MAVSSIEIINLIKGAILLNIISKLNHWSIFLLALFLGITGIFGCTIFSHDSIVPNLEYAYGINEIQSGKASQFFISKLFRGLMWNWHYYAGLAITLLLFVNMLLAFYRPQRTTHSWMNFRKNPYPILMLLIMIVLCVTGVLRYYRGDITFMGEHDMFIRNLPRHIHHYAAWAFSIVMLLHVAQVVWINHSKIKTLISDMFTSKDFHFSFLAFSLSTILATLGAFSSLYASEVNNLPYIIVSKQSEKFKEDKNYKEAMEFYSGKKGFWHEKKAFPNCPYDACEKNSDVVQSFEENGERYYNIKMHDFKSAKALFDKSVAETKNPLSAEKNIIMIMERLNYKSRQYEDYLLEHIKTSLAIDGSEAINKEVKKNLQYIDTHNSPIMLFKAAEVYEHGYFGVEPDIEKAKFFYKSVIDKNDTSNMYFMLAKNKFAILTK